MTQSRLVVWITFALFLIAQEANAQDIAISLEDGASLSATALQLIAALTLLSLAPGLAVMITCFPFVVTVLSILRQAIGLQQSPPNMLIVSLALFLTYYVMDPVFQEAWVNGLKPYTEELITIDVAFDRAIAPFRVFMAARLDSETFNALAEVRRHTQSGPLSEAPLSLLVPSFMLSEIERAFQIGFLIFLPFLIIDLVVAAVLMSMGMMMVPPAIVSLPFKLAFFAVADGWTLISGALVSGYFQ